MFFFFFFAAIPRDRRFFFFSSRRRHTRSLRDWSSDVCSSDLRAGGKSTVFGAFLDSTTDRVGEGAMLAAIALVFARKGNDTAVVFTIVGVAGSFLVPYVRAKAEALGLRGDVGLGSRAERVVVITAGLVFAPWGGLQWAIYLLAVTAWFTVGQRVLSVRRQLRSP